MHRAHAKTRTRAQQKPVAEYYCQFVGVIGDNRDGSFSDEGNQRIAEAWLTARQHSRGSASGRL